MAIGIGIALLLKSAPKWIFGEDLIIVNILRYVLAVFWIVGLFPMIIKKVFK